MKELKVSIEACTRCGLHTSCNRIIFGEGNPNAEIMLVGEGPGVEEDRVGRPFIGRSGQLLDKILKACGFTREDHVFISNIVRCRPPANRVPHREEIVACLPWLHRQIELVDPRIVVTLGATPLKALTGSNSSKITELRGTWINWNDRLLMPVYHPAALLRSPHLKVDTWSDFKKIVATYRDLVDPDHLSPRT